MSYDNVTADDLEASELECVNCQWRPVNAIAWRKLSTGRSVPGCPKCGCATFSPCKPVKPARTAWEILNDEVEELADAILAED
jgi:hypothetical protein